MSSGPRGPMFLSYTVVLGQLIDLKFSVIFIWDFIYLPKSQMSSVLRELYFFLTFENKVYTR